MMIDVKEEDEGSNPADSASETGSDAVPTVDQYKYGGLRQTPQRGRGNPINRLATIKKLLNKLKNNTEMVVEPSCLMLDPICYADPAYGILFFFLEISEYEGYENSVDLAYLNSLFERGADITMTDKLGQTILHDCARIHKITTAKYFIRSGADVNKQDAFGRTALHIAARRDYVEMAQLLIDNGADMKLVTNGACFTALHCAAMGDAERSIECLIKANCDMEITDYRGRTPLLIAAEYDRRSATAKLIEMGVSTRVVDYTGLHALSLLIAKMPRLALQALDQCFTLDKKSRELKVWVNYMEPDLLVPKDARYGFSVIDEVSKSGDSDLVQHPAIKALISTKWKQFGQRNVIKDIGLYLIYLMSWSLLTILTPLTPPDENEVARGSRRLITETVAYIFYIGFVLEEFGEARQGQIQQRKWKNMRIGQVQSDMKIVRPLSAIDRQFLNCEMERAMKTKSQYFEDYWNVYDWVTYGIQFIGIVVYIYCELVTIQMDPTDEVEVDSFLKIFRVRSQLMSVGILLSWFKVFKYVRVFQSLGPFVVIITHSIGDIAKVAFVYIVLYIPMVCIFFQFYGGRGIGGYEEVQDVMFTVFRMIVVDDYSYANLLATGTEEVAEEVDEPDCGGSVRTKRRAGGGSSGGGGSDSTHKGVWVDQWWTRCLVAYWILVSSVVLLNIFIALMSDTFQRVYDNAVGVAALEKAEMISGLESKLNKKSRDRFLKDLEENYSPLVEFQERTAHDDESTEEMAKLENIQMRVENLERLIDKSNGELRRELNEHNDGHKRILDRLDERITEIYLRGYSH